MVMNGTRAAAAAGATEKEEESKNLVVIGQNNLHINDDERPLFHSILFGGNSMRLCIGARALYGSVLYIYAVCTGGRVAISVISLFVEDVRAPISKGIKLCMRAGWR